MGDGSERISQRYTSVGRPQATPISECSSTPIPNVMPPSCMSLPLFVTAPTGCAVCISAVGDRLWIFWAVLPHTHGKANLIMAFAKRGREAASCQRARCAHDAAHPCHRPDLCVNDWQAFSTVAARPPPSSIFAMGKLSLSSSPSFSPTFLFQT